MENTERPSLVIPNETNDSNAFVKVNEPRLLNPKKHFNGSSKCKLVKKKFPLIEELMKDETDIQFLSEVKIDEIFPKPSIQNCRL